MNQVNARSMAIDDPLDGSESGQPGASADSVVHDLLTAIRPVFPRW